MRIQVNDRVLYSISRREYTDEGFLRVPGRVARTGVQEYFASELGLTDRAPYDIVRVNRPPDEVFNDASLSSYDGADVTVEHPDQMVSADTYRSVSVGVVRGAGTVDGDFVECELIIKDKNGIDAAESGKVQLSAGYTALYDDNVPEGADYDFIQRDIKINHVALVDRARAGAQARLFDSKNGDKPMAKVTIDSGRVVEVADESTAVLINETIDRLKQRADDAETNLEKEKAAKDTLTEELETAKKAASDSAISERVKMINAVNDQARKIAGETFSCDSLLVPVIQREALAVKRPNINWGDKSDVYVQAAWDQAAEADEDDKDDKDDKDSKDNYRQLSQDAARKQQEVSDTARVKANDSMTGAWKKTVGGES